MTLRCLMFGHVRSRSRATFDEKRQRWISECRRCRIPMIREEDGAWHEMEPPSADKLVPIEPEVSAASDAGAAEAPLSSTGTPDTPERRRPGASENKKKAGEFSAA